MNEIYPVYTLKNECHDCYKCVRECQVKAIKIQDGSASVLNEKCIACGHCVIACPSNAKRVRNDIDKVKTLLIAQKKVYASLAPSWTGLWGIEPKKMIAALKKLGFYGVSETALGAQEVSIQTAKLLNTNQNGLFISSACPVIVDYIRLYRPEYSKNITPVASPALTHAGMLKEMYGKDISVVFIGPCIAKKNEADRHPELIDASLTFEELNLWIKDEFIDTEELKTDENDCFVPQGANEGAIYPIEGGMNETIKKVGVDKNTVLINISGLKAFENAISGFKIPNDKKIFLEALSCDSGCINGPCKSSQKGGISAISDILSKVKFREEIPKNPKIVIKENYSTTEKEKENYSLEEINEAMTKIGKTKEEDELNCGGCGYATCRDLAKALLRGDAEPSMCVSYMRKIAMKKSAAMLRCMPSAIVMVDKELNILETNDSFVKMFLQDEMYQIFSNREEGLKGAAIDRIVSFGDIFSKMLKFGVDIHKEHYPVGDKLYDINAFTIEKGEIVGAVITDVTANETDREKIAQKAKEVISKNIATVQEIACLLGEHMVETEVLLNSIAQDYSADNNNESDK